MRCFICDVEINGDEIQFNTLHKDWDPCGNCQHIIDEVFEPLEEEDIDYLLEQEGLIEPVIPEEQHHD